MGPTSDRGNGYVDVMSSLDMVRVINRRGKVHATQIVECPLGISDGIRDSSQRQPDEHPPSLTQDKPTQLNADLWSHIYNQSADAWHRREESSAGYDDIGLGCCWGGRGKGGGRETDQISLADNTSNITYNA